MSALSKINEMMTSYYEASEKWFPSLDSHKWVKEHTATYKTGVLACHFFRMIVMLPFIHFLPFSKFVNCTLSLGMSTFYGIVIEKKNCGYNFAIISCLGAFALDASKVGLYALITGIAFTSLRAFALTLIQIIPSLLYVISAIWLTNIQVEKQKAVLPCKNCTPNVL